MGIMQFPVPLGESQSRVLLPMAREWISAGFPSPANDYIDIGIDLNEQLIRHPTSTFFLRVSGDCMIGAGIHNGDLLIVDRSLNPRPGHVVVAVLDGAFTLKRLNFRKGVLSLEADHPNYPQIDLRQYGEIYIWGVAIHSIHNLVRLDSSK